jgi:hypothetical protein
MPTSEETDLMARLQASLRPAREKREREETEATGELIEMEALVPGDRVVITERNHPHRTRAGEVVRFTKGGPLLGGEMFVIVALDGAYEPECAVGVGGVRRV